MDWLYVVEQSQIYYVNDSLDPKQKGHMLLIPIFQHYEIYTVEIKK